VHINQVGIKGPEVASGVGRMKKAEAAAYAEAAQTKGTAWLPSPIRPAKAAEIVADRFSVDDDSGNDAHGVADEAGEADQPKHEMMQVAEAAK